MKEVYTIDDLASRASLDEGTDHSARVAVIGCPVAHSLSPQLHQGALDEAESGTRYIRLEVSPGKVNEALNRLASLRFVGANVTVPHKFEALAAAAGGAAAIGRALSILEREIQISLALTGVADVVDLHPGLMHRAQPLAPSHALSAFPLLEEGY